MKEKQRRNPEETPILPARARIQETLISQASPAIPVRAGMTGSLFRFCLFVVSVVVKRFYPRLTIPPPNSFRHALGGAHPSRGRQTPPLPSPYPPRHSRASGNPGRTFARSAASFVGLSALRAGGNELDSRLRGNDGEGIGGGFFDFVWQFHRPTPSVPPSAGHLPQEGGLACGASRREIRFWIPAFAGMTSSFLAFRRVRRG
jgi:hypothetical protein